MKCPIHRDTDLKSAVFYNTEVDYCPLGLGIWFEKNELRIAKDSKDSSLEWLDVNLWEDKTKFEISKEDKICPECEVPMYEVSYGDSNVLVDVCTVCEGIWLDRGEFKKIVNYLREEVNEKILDDYGKTLIEETTEVFTGPESLEDEISDVLVVIGLLKHKLAAEHPTLAEIISDLPR